MNPAKIRRNRLRQLTDLPNVGAAVAKDLELIGVRMPQQLVGKDPLKLYRALCRRSGVRHDPCVLDVLMSVIRFMDGSPPRPWWAYTSERKRRYGRLTGSTRSR